MISHNVEGSFISAKQDSKHPDHVKLEAAVNSDATSKEQPLSFTPPHLTTITHSGRKRSRLIKPVGGVQQNDSGDNASALIFQHCAQSILNDTTEANSNNTDESDAASIFFELANSPLIGYQINGHQTIVIRQDGNYRRKMYQSCTTSPLSKDGHFNQAQ